MSVRTFTLASANNEYSDMYSNSYYTNGTSGPRATRNATKSNQSTLARNIASSHKSELKAAYEYIEDGNVSAFNNVIEGIAASEAGKQRTYNIKDEEIRSAIEDAYQQVVGADYDTSIAGTKQSSYRSGFNKGILFGLPYATGLLGDCKSSAEYTAERRGTTVNAEEQAEEVKGRIASTAVSTGVVAGLAVAAKAGAIKAVCHGIASVAVNFPGHGWGLALAAIAVGTIATALLTSPKSN